MFLSSFLQKKKCTLMDVVTLCAANTFCTKYNTILLLYYVDGQFECLTLVFTGRTMTWTILVSLGVYFLLDKKKRQKLFTLRFSYVCLLTTLFCNLFCWQCWLKFCNQMLAPVWFWFKSDREAPKERSIRI